jgi:U3 small nucleolar RNA-associated protein 18
MVAGKVDFVPGVLGREEKSWESHVVSPDGRNIAFLGNDGYVVLIDPNNKQATGFLKLNGSVRSVAFTPDGKHLLASGSDGDITRQVFLLPWKEVATTFSHRFPFFSDGILAHESA